MAYTVGYTTVDLVPGKQVVKGASFVTVGDDELDLQDITVSGCADYEAQIWWWNGSSYDAKAYWFTELYDADENGLGYSGWGDFLAWTPVDKTFAPGEAFWIQVNSDVGSASVTMAGQVASTSTSEEYYGVPLTPGQQVQMTNPFPTGTLSLQDIKTVGCADYEAQIWWWNGSSYDAKAYWFTELYDADENGLGYSGWGDFLAWTPISKAFTEGEGFWVQVNSDVSSATLKFPNPFYVAP